MAKAPIEPGQPRVELVLDVGGVRMELRHSKGETDDHAWARW